MECVHGTRWGKSCKILCSLSLTPPSLIRPQPQQQATPAQQADPTLQCLELGLSQLTLFSHAPVPQAGLDRKKKGEIGSVTAPLDYPLCPWSNPSMPSSLSWLSCPLSSMLWYAAINRTPGGHQLGNLSPSRPSSPDPETSPASEPRVT
jgi:hypothetical protein